jgi:elongation factor 1-beta
MSTFSVQNDTKLAEIEKHLTANNYLSNGALPDGTDAQIFIDLAGNAPNRDKYPHFYFWYVNLALFAEPVLKSWVEKKGGKAQETKKADKGGDDVDLFGEETEDDKAKLDKIKKDKEEKDKAKKVKEPVVGRTIVIFDVKVFEMEQDLNALAQKIIAIQQEGLQWRTEYQLVEIAYGMKCLRIGMTVEDDKVVIEEDVLDKIRDWEDEVQSVDIASMQKV